ncbi:hypothetical protein HKD37_18G050322 [Glycine soja]
MRFGFSFGVVFINMARSPDKIKNIDDSKETLKLAVRISDLWFIGMPNKSEQVEMVFVDSDGDEIHDVCKQDQLKSWKMDLKENCTYVMHNFKVLKNNGQYRVCDHQFKLVFIGVAVVRQCVLNDLPFRKYKFAGFADVVAGQFEPGLLVDVIDVVDEVVFRHVSRKGRRFLDDHEGHGPITIPLTHGRIKEAQGSYPPSVNNSFKASKLIINQPVMKIQEFNERLAGLGIEARSVFKSHGQGSSQLSGSIQLSSKESFFGKAEAKTIAEINTISEEIVCVTVGTITRIVMDNHSWCYIACIQCHKKIDAKMAPFTCACGKYNQEVVLRYRLEVMINHRDENTKFLLWDRECTELIGQSVDTVNRLKNEDGDVDLNASPQALDKLLGYVLAFKIKVQPKFRKSAILKCSTDSSLIDVVMDMLPNAETSSKINVPTFDSNHSTEHEPSTLTTANVSDSSEDEGSESTQGYSDLGDQLMQCTHCNANISPHNQIQGHIVSQLSEMLDEYNMHAKTFRMTRDRLQDGQVDNIKLKLIANREKYGHTYNVPTIPEVAVLIVGAFDANSKRDIIIETQHGQLQRIHELHSSYLALQYPLLFPYGEDGYRPDILHSSAPDNKKRKRNRLTMREWFAYKLQCRSNESKTLNNPKKLRVDKFCSLQHSLDDGSTKDLNKGKRVILPSTFIGSPRYMDQLYFDGITICSHVGFPNLFITLTYNPNWPEIHKLLNPLNLKATNRPDIISRVFKLKYEQILMDLTKNQMLGKLLHLDDMTLQNLVLLEIEQLLQANQRSLTDYPSMSYPEDVNFPTYLDNSLILAELNYNNQELRSEFEHLFSQMTDEQASIYNQIVEAVNKDEGGIFFLYGYGGTEKTYIWKKLASSLRTDNKIVIMVASSGITSLLLPGGRTAHSKFKIPVLQSKNLSPTSTTTDLHTDYCAHSRPIFRCSIQCSTVPKPLNLPPDAIEIPAFYHRQWEPNYPEFVEFKYDGANYEIRVRKHKGKLLFADGLTTLRIELQIYESTTINFLACDHHSKFDLHFTAPLHQQTCKRQRHASRKHIWTYPIT